MSDRRTEQMAQNMGMEMGVVRSWGGGSVAVRRRRCFVMRMRAVKGVGVSSVVGGRMEFGVSVMGGVGLVWRRGTSMDRLEWWRSWFAWGYCLSTWSLS